eukprot:gene6934-14073_t
MDANKPGHIIVKSSRFGKPYVQMVFYAALADLIGAISTVFGEVEDGTHICTAQGILSNIFPLASVFWTLAITYLLYANVVLLKPFAITYHLHMACWGFPTLITLFIYTTNRIGLPDPDNVGWCFVGNTSSSPDWSMSFWTMMSFYVWIFLSIVAMVAILIVLHIETGKMKASRSKIMSNNTAQITVSSVYIYPAVVFLCWIIPCVTDMIDAQSTSSYAGKEILNSISSTLPLIQGFITSTVFCLRTSYIRRVFTNLSTFSKSSKVLVNSVGSDFNKSSRNLPVSTFRKVNQDSNYSVSIKPSSSKSHLNEIRVSPTKREVSYSTDIEDIEDNKEILQSDSKKYVISGKMDLSIGYYPENRK